MTKISAHLKNILHQKLAQIYAAITQFNFANRRVDSIFGFCNIEKLRSF